MKGIFSIAYWPNLHYFYYLINADEIHIETHDHYQKQSYRNRCSILSANGVLDLSIPVKHQATKELVKDVEISYQENWQQKHWRAIVSAYKNSPYFEHFETEIELFYSSETQYLLSYTRKQLELILKLLRIKKEIHYSENYSEIMEGFVDFREMIHPKKDFKKDENYNRVLSAPYYQTFSEKMLFVPNLSILDLIFNKGLESLGYLNYTGK